MEVLRLQGITFITRARDNDGFVNLFECSFPFFVLGRLCLKTFFGFSSRFFALVSVNVFVDHVVVHLGLVNTLSARTFWGTDVVRPPLCDAAAQARRVDIFINYQFVDMTTRRQSLSDGVVWSFRA